MVSLEVCRICKNGNPCEHLETIKNPWSRRTAKIKVCNFFGHEKYRPRDLSVCPLEKYSVYPLSEELKEKLNDFDYEWPIVGKDG
jgi:hypothetical protein